MSSLTVALLLLLSGLWCVYLSPVTIYGPGVPNTAWQRIFYEPIFQPNATVVYNFTVQTDQHVRIQIKNIEVIARRFYTAFIYDSKSNLVFEKQSDSELPLEYLPNETGLHMLNIHNQPYVNTSLTVEITGYYALFRPLTSIGQLLVLISLPIYVFATSVLTKRWKIIEVLVLTSATVLLLSGLWSLYLSPIEHILPPNLSDVNIAWTKNFPAREFQPNSVVDYNFTAEEGQYVQVQIHNLWFTDYKTIEYILYDSQNNIILENHLVFPGNVEFGFLSKTTGQYTLRIHNQPDVMTQLIVEITGYYATFKPLAFIGVFLILISLPLYGLSVWLMAKKEKGSIQSSICCP
ncbi:MAG: hypothetical protein QXU21_00815 [Candidatus Bathyarchaeia archaeon]